MQFEHTITINALIKDVWETTIDVDNWPRWAPTISSVRRVDQGVFGVNSQARIKQPAMPETTWTVSLFVPYQRFAWSANVRGMRLVAEHCLIDNGESTSNTLILKVDGLVARLLWPILAPQFNKALAQENEGLRRFCESKSLQVA